jgi:hypothetical protein
MIGSMTSKTTETSQSHIKTKSLKTWTTHWKKTTQEQYYSQFDQTPSFHQRRRSQNADRLSFATFFTQMKIDHDYFKSYLHRLSDYDNKKCHDTCNKNQTSASIDSLSILKQSELKISSDLSICHTAKDAVYLFIYLFFIHCMQPIRLWWLRTENST